MSDSDSIAPFVPNTAIGFVPENEVNVREWFAANAGALGWRILKSRAGFPDFLLLSPDRQKVRVEVEFKSGSFIAHQHDASKCDLVMCWLHTVALTLPIWELSTGKRYAVNVGPEILDEAAAREFAEKMRKRHEKLLAKWRKVIAGLEDEILVYRLAFVEALKAYSEFHRIVTAPQLCLDKVAGALFLKLRAAKLLEENPGSYELNKILMDVQSGKFGCAVETADFD